MGKQRKKGDSRALTISHPNSRKAKSLTKKVMIMSTRKKTKMASAVKRNIFGEKLVWFHDNLDPEEEYTGTMLDLLYQKYLSRFDEELEQIEIKHAVGQRKNRQHASRQDIIKMTKKREFEEYNSSGIEMVNILSRKQLKMFREWDGELGFLNQFKIVRFSKSFLAKYKPPVHPAGASTETEDVEEMNEEESVDEVSKTINTSTVNDT